MEKSFSKKMLKITLRCLNAQLWDHYTMKWRLSPSEHVITLLIRDISIKQAITFFENFL